VETARYYLKDKYNKYNIILNTKICTISGMSERDGVDHKHGEDRTDLPPEHAVHHDHSDNIDLADLVVDEEHLVDDLGGIYTKAELDTMDVDEKVMQTDSISINSTNCHSRCSHGSARMTGTLMDTSMDWRW
jgi:hypothetical protein